ncbi:MAG: peroxiredoxin [Candidatus Omnitrophica bacterium]|nr:peroxiredoxin [Candidatus Omnitrophota bacterium]
MAKEEIKIGGTAPDFSLKDEKESVVHLSDFKGRWVVFYFYPKDNTPGCTIEAHAFTKFLKEFTKQNAVILGVSPDSCGSHVKFIGEQGLKIRLLSDPDHKVLETYGAWQLKENYGKKYWGVVRSTVLIDPEGRIAHLWKTVRADGHAEAVLEKLREFLRQEKLAQNQDDGL